MASGKALAARLLADLPLWVSATAEYNDSVRFEALTLLEQGRTRLAEIEAKPPADASSVAVAVLHPMHLIVKALLAAKGYRALSTRAALEVLKRVYGSDLPEAQLDACVRVQGLRLQGAKAIEAARSFVETGAALVTRAG